MGSPPEEAGAPNENPAHEVTIGPFFLSKYEMTQAQWARFTNLNPSYFRAGSVADRHPVTDTHPVENVELGGMCADAVADGPTLADGGTMGNAARADTTTRHSTGDDPHSLKHYVNILDSAAKRGTEIRTPDPGEMWLDDGHAFHAPVGTYLPNPFGHHDMHGNLMESCWDLSGRYTAATRPGTGERVVCGGGFSSGATDVRSTRR
jgi:formylglycine-generating enzyme required for sulfatase activity